LIERFLLLPALGGRQLLNEWLHDFVRATQPGENTEFYVQIFHALRVACKFH